MSNTLIGVIVLFGITIPVAAYFHSRVRSLVSASLASAVVSTFLFQALAYVQLGYLDKFFPIEVVVGACYAFWIAFAFGAIIRAIGPRSQRDTEHPTDPTRTPDDNDRNA